MRKTVKNFFKSQVLGIMQELIDVGKVESASLPRVGDLLTYGVRLANLRPVSNLLKNKKFIQLGRLVIYCRYVFYNAWKLFKNGNGS